LTDLILKQVIVFVGVGERTTEGRKQDPLSTAARSGFALMVMVGMMVIAVGMTVIVMTVL